MSSFIKVQRNVDLLRIYNASAAVLAFAIGFVYSRNPFGYTFFLGAIFIVLAHCVVTIDNDIEDIEIDQVNDSEKILPQKLISLNEAKLFKNFLLASILVLLFLFPSTYNFLFVASCLALGWIYNKPPFQISRNRPILSILLLGLTYTALPYLYGVKLSGLEFNISILLIVFFLFLQRISISMLKDFKDEIGDKQFKKQTLYLKVGKRAIVRMSLFFSIISYLGIFTTFFIFKSTNLFLLFPVIFSVSNILDRFKLLKTNQNDKLNNIFRLSFFGENRFELIFLLWLIFT